MTHIHGLERLFAVRGPLMIENSTSLDRALLETCRPVMILAAFFTQKPSVMQNLEWKATFQPRGPGGAPCSNYVSNAESDRAFLMGILAELPTLYIQCEEYVQSWKANPACSSSAGVTTVWTKTRQLQQELHAWHQGWKDFCHQNDFGENLPTLVESNSFTTIASTNIYTVDSVELAVTSALYHSVVILLTSIPTTLHQAGLGGLACMSSSLADISIRNRSQLQSDVKTCILSIYGSSQYLLRSPQQSQAPADFHIFFPIHVARRASIQLGLASELARVSESFDLMRFKYPMGVWVNMDFGDRFSGFQEGLFG